MNKYQIYCLIIAVSSAILESYFDSRKRNPEKIISSIVRVLVATSISFTLFVGLWYQILNAISMLVAFWIVFDISYNVFKGRPIVQMGKTSFLDKTFSKLGADMYGYTALKGVFLAIILTLMNYV